MAGDLSVTALYCAETWRRAGLPGAELFATVDARRVFDATNAALGVARLVRRDLPPLRTSLLHRHLIIDRLARGARSIVELGAGLSRRGAALSADPAVRYVEIDLPATIAKKRALLERTAAGRAVLARDNLVLVGADVETAELAPLAAPAGPARAPLVIAEGLAMYLAGPARRALFAKVAAIPGARFVFDLVPIDEQPAPGRVGRALEAAMKRFTGGRAFERDARSRAQLLGELADAGFGGVEVVTPAAVARAWALPDADAATSVVVFSCAPGSPS